MTKGAFMRLFLWAFLWVTSLVAAGELVVYDASSLWTPLRSNISLIGGKSFSLGRSPSRGESLWFEDLQPLANWEHPARFKIINPNGTVKKTLPVRRPPLALKDLPILRGARAPAVPPAIQLSSFGGAYQVSDPTSYYAVLINGHADQRHWNDFSFLYRTLRTVYGYNRANIFVADSNFKDIASDLSGEGKIDITSGSTLADVQTLFERLKTLLKPTDHLLIAVNDHGGLQGSESTIILNDTEITATDFSKLVTALPTRRLLAIYEQCFSGGFVRPTVAYNRVAMSASTENESSWASQDGIWDEFIFRVIEAFAMQTPQGAPLTDPLIAGKKVSAHDAFAYAFGKDAAWESPKLEAYANTGFAPQIGLGF